MTNYDLIIIGAGPGGYVAAERAGHKGLNVLIIERSYLGGVCLNEGCIPSKTLLYSAKLFKQARSSEAYGVTAENVSFSLETAMGRKQKIMENLRKGVAFQMKRNKVTVVEGEAKFTSRTTVEVNGESYTGKYIIIATGSEAIRPPIPGADQDHVMTSREVLVVEKLPKAIAIVGGGVIGMEFACFFTSVGVKVTVIEMLPEILPPFDPDLSAALKKSLGDVDYKLSCKVKEITADAVIYEENGEDKSVTADAVLLSIGRSPNTQNIGLEEIGLDFDRRGIKVNDKLETNLPGIYAVGDVNGLSPLAHSASRMGEVVVNNLTGRKDHMRYTAIPLVVYTNPEIAAVGITEAEAKEQGIAVEVFTMPMTANGRYLAEHEKGNGLCKVVVNKDSRVLLGVHLLGQHCSEMVFGAAAMIEAEFRIEDIQDCVFPHPSVSEIIRDTIWAMA
ncbi:MAG: dihydrolipoyl dehydrogenase [Lentisphaeria bacterium]|nr:dihydrolipoyl dehydrogenase [Lentisphaeria bacterium]NQZ68283.1 dihydrolipoyl dehydrogenase [Lentisphaeria bacterium]